MHQKSFLLVFSHSLLGVGFFLLYIFHIRSVFESRTGFSQLTPLERLSFLRKDDALYFSFYKIIAEEKSFSQGISKLHNLTSIEHPNGINVLSRFHVLPELTIGYIYHLYKYLGRDVFGNLPTSASNGYCFKISDSPIAGTVMSCDDISEPFMFYLEYVWFMGGLTIFIVYMYGAFLSENIFGGIYSVVLYVIFHKNASKIYERPVARENFAFPFILWQMSTMCLYMQKTSTRSTKQYQMQDFYYILKLTVLSTIALQCWQFSSVIFATQLLIIIATMSLGSKRKSLFSISYALSQFLANVCAYYLSYENKKYFFAWQNGPAIALVVIEVFRLYLNRSRHNSGSDNAWQVVYMEVLMAFTLQGIITDSLQISGMAKPFDNPYTIYKDLILLWSIQKRTNFSTSLLGCDPDYSEINFDDLFELLKTLFIKPYCLYGVVILGKFFRKWRKQAADDGPSTDQINRSKNYLLEDFLESNHLSLMDLSKKETEEELNACYELLESCKYDYEQYKLEQEKKIQEPIKEEHKNFVDDVKKLKEEIFENERKLEQKATASEGASPQSADEETKSEETKDEANHKDSEKPKVSKGKPKEDNFYSINNHYVYSVTQLAVFALLGVNLRKLFFLCYTQGCVLAPTLCSKFWYKKQRNIFWTISLLVFFTSIFDPGLQNLKNEYLPEKTVDNDVTALMQWINMNTEPDAVFGGPTDLIGTVFLATGRSIVNHASLDMPQISERTEHVYSVFSRQQSSDIYNLFSQINMQYLIISFKDCISTNR
ncbi:DPY19L1 family protein [Megaselia abdita]